MTRKRFGLNTRARESQADKIFDECLEIADNASKDYTERQNKDGTTCKVFDIEHVQRARLRIDTRKWMAGKLQPKKYGDNLKIDQTTTHEAGDSLTALMSAIDGKTRTM